MNGLDDQVTKIKGLEHLSLWQKLNSFASHCYREPQLKIVHFKKETEKELHKC